MSSTYRLALDPEADDDLRAIRTYFAGRKPEVGESILASILEVFFRLEVDPTIGDTVASGAYRVARTRRYDYFVSNRVEGDVVRVARVHHPRSDRSYGRRATTRPLRPRKPDRDSR